MRMVVDSNVLQTSSLREFLSKARTNKAVITDYLMIEALKGDPLGKIFGLMKILCEFPKQVIVLKGLRSISALKGRRSGMTRRMIEKGQTRGYENWCAGLAKAEAGDADYRTQLVERGKEADVEMDALIAAQAHYAHIIADEAKNYTQNELLILRTDEPYTPQMIDKMAERIVNLMAKFLESHPDGIRTPTVWELPYTYMFRLAVCAYLQTADLMIALAKSSKNSKANRIETGERSGRIGEICSVLHGDNRAITECWWREGSGGSGLSPLIGLKLGIKTIAAVHGTTSTIFRTTSVI
jgi:hypothetical protein